MGGKNKGGGWITYQPVDYDVENTVNEIKAQMDTANVAEKAKGVTHTQQTVLKKLAEEQKKVQLGHPWHDERSRQRVQGPCGHPSHAQ